MKTLLILLFLALGFTCVIVYASDRELINTVKELRKKTQPDNNSFQKEVESVYDSMRDRLVVPEVVLPSVDIFKDDQSRIMQSLNLPEAKDILQNSDPDGSCFDPQKLGDYRIFVFISSSIPESTLKNYMQDALKLSEALLVMRGVIGSASQLKPTQDFITQISCGKKVSELTVADKCNISRVDINPILFSLFNIGEVPAIVYSRLSYQELMIRANTGKVLADDDYFIIYGDNELSYALEKFDTAGANLSSKVKQLRGGY